MTITVDRIDLCPILTTKVIIALPGECPEIPSGQGNI